MKTGSPTPAQPSSTAVVQINKALSPPQTTWDELIAPQVKQVEDKVAAEQAVAKAQEAYQADLNATAARLMSYGSIANTYSPGQCTWYVASRINVPSYMGNARNWGYGLLNAGWRTGPPRRGAIAVTQEGWAGHVAVVEAVTGAGVTISEMNYNGPFLTDMRTVSEDSFTYYY